MDDEGALLDTIAASPDDDLPRLVYADWVEEHGDGPRAAFIRAHVELARTPRDAPAFERLAATASDLFRAHYAGWLGAFVLPGEAPWPAVTRPKLGGFFSRLHRWHLDNPGGPELFRGGAFDCVRLPDDAPGVAGVTVDCGLVGHVSTRNRAVDLSGHPVGDLRVELAGGEPAGFALDQPALARVHTLALDCQTEPPPEVCAAVGGSAHWRPRSLDVRCWAATASTRPLVEAFAAGRAARTVRRLALSHRTFDGFAALARWPAGVLEDLRLSGSVAPYALGRWSLARDLLRLDLSGCELSGLGVGGLTDGRPWDRLTALDLTDVRDTRTEAGLVELAHTILFPAVTRLSVRGIGFTDAAADEFAVSPWPARLKVLDVSETLVTAAGLLPLARALRDGPLEQLRAAFIRGEATELRALRHLLGPRLVEVPAG